MSKRTGMPELSVETLSPVAIVPEQRAVMPWWLAALGGAIITAVVGWALAGGTIVLSQLAQTGAIEPASWRLATQAWLLAGGGVLATGGLSISLMPLTLTAIFALLFHGLSGFAARQAVRSRIWRRRPGGLVMATAGLIAAVYLAVLVIVMVTLDLTENWLRLLAWGLVLAGLSSLLGARRAIGWDWSQRWPGWARALPRAMAAGVLSALAGSVLLLAIGLLIHRQQFIALTQALQPGWGGGIILGVIQAFYLLTFALWALSWASGPGFSVGDGSLVSLTGSQVGLLPGLPITAIIPSETVTGPGALVPLLVPVLAGALAAVAALRRRRAARFDETALVGGLAGVLSGLVLVALMALSRGSLGSERLVDLGPDMSIIVVTL
ncbi:MAG: DUF6350 family protein, partial [Propionibacteriaceae bacterium]|nr:DUF6350 family protein [Propionibacteriaceae bacterium]